MSEFIIDDVGNQIWYDLTSDTFEETSRIIWFLMKNKKEFFVRPHREDGPAIIMSNGNEYYYMEGLLHNENGPAVVNNHYNLFHIKGKNFSFLDWCNISNKTEEEINFLKLKWNIV